MKRYWNHRDAEMEMLLSAAYLQLQRPGYKRKPGYWRYRLREV